MKAGILIIGDPDPIIISKGKKNGLAVQTSETISIPFDKTLIVSSGTRVPWDLLPAGWNFLERWDAAAPLWRYGVTAGDLGSSEERELTRSIVRDLRVLVYSHELLFVRNNAAGSALIETWLSEMQRGEERRLAFLRAYYQVKPRFCVLPVSWLAEVRAHPSAGARAPRMHRARPIPAGGQKLVKVEIAPGRFVKCAPGDEERVLAFHREKLQTRKRG